jgi:uncharacterized protein (TIGR03067 family)
METDMRLLTLLAIGLFAGSLLAEDKKPKVEEAILGKWQMEKIDVGNPEAKLPPAEKLAKMSITFKKDGKLVSVLSPDGSETEGDYKLDATAKLNAIDITKTGEKTANPGVFELDGDKLTICLNQTSSTRPSEIKADGKGVFVMVLKRVKDGK